MTAEKHASSARGGSVKQLKSAQCQLWYDSCISAQAPPSAPKSGVATKNGSSRAAGPVSVQAGQDMTYSLSIVRLAEPSHAEMRELNVTAGNITTTVQPNPKDHTCDLPFCLVSHSGSSSNRLLAEQAYYYTELSSF